MTKKIEYLILKNENVVNKEDYIKAKFLDLKEDFNTITEDDVREQLRRVQNKEELTMIGQFIKDDLR